MVELCWLGQSGFIVSNEKFTLIADPYLSDSCAKLSGSFDHTRHTPIVRDPAQLRPDIYLITHSHADHFDPETIAPVMANHPGCRFFCPGDCGEKIDRFFPDQRHKFEFVSAGKAILPAPGVEVHIIPAAHEELETDPSGEYKAVSYLVNFRRENISFFLAGDTVLYPGQNAAILRSLPAGAGLIMCLPVNGRDDARHALGIAGNMNVDEAITLFRACNGTLFIPCHIGLFPANDPAEPVTAEYCKKQGAETLLPEAGEIYRF